MTVQYLGLWLHLHELLDECAVAPAQDKHLRAGVVLLADVHQRAGVGLPIQS